VGESLLQLTRNPTIAAVVAGFGAAWLQIPISPTLARAINTLAVSSTAVALSVIGGALSTCRCADRRDLVAAPFRA